MQVLHASVKARVLAYWTLFSILNRSGAYGRHDADPLQIPGCSEVNPACDSLSRASTLDRLSLACHCTANHSAPRRYQRLGSLRPMKLSVQVAT